MAMDKCEELCHCVPPNALEEISTYHTSKRVEEVLSSGTWELSCDRKIAWIAGLAERPMTRRKVPTIPKVIRSPLDPQQHTLEHPMFRDWILICAQLPSPVVLSRFWFVAFKSHASPSLSPSITLFCAFFHIRSRLCALSEFNFRIWRISLQESVFTKIFLRAR